MDHIFENIPGWFNFDYIYDIEVKEAQDGAHFVEVGSWKGRSSVYLAVLIANSGKQIRLDCVDTWLGSNEVAHTTDADVVDNRLYEVFLENIDPVKHIINPVRLTSIEAAKLHEDNSLDFVFLDASHEYEDVKNDILAWLPKVKPGCMLAGDDYGCPGVQQAVDEIFPDIETSAHWGYKKP